MSFTFACVYIYTCIAIHIGYPPLEFFLNQTGRPIFLSTEYPIHQQSHSIKVSELGLSGSLVFRNLVMFHAERYSSRIHAECVYIELIEIFYQKHFIRNARQNLAQKLLINIVSILALCLLTRVLMNCE